MFGRSLLKIAKAHMATDFEFDVVVTDSSSRGAESVLMEGHALVGAIEGEITEFREDSPVWRLNHSIPGEWISMEPFLAELFDYSLKLVQDSAGYFDPCAKSEGGAEFFHLEVDLIKRCMRRTHPGLHLGFGAIGKGYALDRVASLLLREGFSDFRLNSGGSSWVFSGEDQNEEPWKIGWAWKRDSGGDFHGRLLVVPRGESLAVGVSGVLEQGNHFRHAGNAVPIEILSSFYAGRSAAEADALSTALMVGASVVGDRILTILENRIRNPSLAYIDTDEHIVYNHCFQTRFLSQQGIGK